MKQWFDQYTTITIADLIAIAISYAIKMVIATILLLIGFWLINKLLRVAESALHFQKF
jgi:uncharacterized membrane protein (Fun14 family)